MERHVTYGMRFGNAIVFAAVACLAMSQVALMCTAGDRLLVGLAESDITPPQGFPIAGYYHERLAEGTIDPLKAKAIVFQQGTTKAAMVVCDLTGISRDLCEAVRARASERTGIPPQAIAVSATHSHTAPDYTKHLYQYLQSQNLQKQNAPASVGVSASEAASSDRSPYAEQLISGIVSAIVAAHERLEPATIASTSATQEIAVSFNRRFVMKDGSVQTWKTLADPKVVRAAGPIDPEIGLVTISSDSSNSKAGSSSAGKVRGVLSNFALHLDTVGGMRWSGDYPYFIEQSLRGRFGNDLVSVFGTGCCGDINHSDPSKRERNKTDAIGRALSATIESALPSVTELANADLDVRSAVVNLPLQDVTIEQLERSKQLLKLIQDGGKVEFLDQVAAYKTLMLSQLRSKPTSADGADKLISWGLLHAWSGVGESLPVEVQTICLGDDVAIVFLPGEIFVELGLAIKHGSPFRNTLVIELSNCVETVYIPTRAACAGGSYEVTNSTVKPGSGEMLVETSLRLLREAASK